jgi:hypothetical protein
MESLLVFLPGLLKLQQEEIRRDLELGLLENVEGNCGHVLAQLRHAPDLPEIFFLLRVAQVTAGPGSQGSFPVFWRV